MSQIYVDPAFTFPNFHRGTNMCHLTVSVNESESRVLIVAAQRHDEWKQGTSAINHAEAIAQRVMQGVMPDLMREHPRMRQAEIVWVIEVITGDDPMYNVRTVANFEWERTPWPSRLLRKHDYSRRPAMSFGRKLSPVDYPHILAHGLATPLPITP